MHSLTKAVLILTALFAGVECSVAGPVTAQFPGTPFNWATSFGVMGGTLKNIQGNVVNYNVPVFDNDPDPTEPSKEQIGNLNFQFILWSGSLTGGANGPTDVFGASIFGGFNRTDVEDTRSTFAFLQTFTDNSFPNGKVDGGNFRGKVNGDIAGFGTWDYAGTQYDYFDNPFDSIGLLPSDGNTETVQFETALECYTSNGTVSILSDFTWGFTLTNNKGTYNLSGTGPTQQASASNSLFNLYFNSSDPPGPTPAGSTPSLMQNIGVGSCHVPEPGTWTLIIFALVLVAFSEIRKLSPNTHRAISGLR